MRFELDGTPLSLVNGALLNISDAKGQSLRVLEGRVWVTQEGYLDDVFLEAGATYRFAGPGSAVVSAEGPADAVATVLFDAPLAVRDRTHAASYWLGFFGGQLASA